MKSQFLRFLLGGGVNTAITYLLFLALTSVMHYSAAYTITYAVGIVLSYVINTILVFRTKPALVSMISFPALYVVQFLYGLLCLYVLMDIFGIVRQIAMLVVIGTGAPLTFLFARAVFSPRGE
jgi:putative flippase GtrA